MFQHSIQGRRSRSNKHSGSVRLAWSPGSWVSEVRRDRKHGAKIKAWMEAKQTFFLMLISEEDYFIIKVGDVESGIYNINITFI